MSLRLVLFDVDGTLVDSQADIVASMHAAFAEVDAPVPSRALILGIVGLSLPQAVAALAPGRSDRDHARMVAAYKTEYARLRADRGAAASSPLYPHVREVLDTLAARDDLLLGTATGKSRRGLDALVDGFGLRGHFATLQCADDHPSKPHPSMIYAAMAATGTEPCATVMVGDTSYDMDMARAAGVTALGVSWGYHRPVQFGAVDVLDDIRDLILWLDHWSAA